MTQIYSYEKIRNDMRLLELLSQSVPNIGAACTEIINLEAILNLPKGTEHFLADIHGEYEAFQHILKNASGNIKRKVNEIFGTTMRESEIRQLCSLIYYPEQKLQYIKNSETNLNDFYNITLHQLVSVCQSVSSKYTRSKVRKALPKEFAYIIEELLHESPQDYNKQAYFNRIIETIVSTGRADEFICASCTSSATSSTAAPERTSSWTHCAITTTSTYSGATTTRFGWGRQPATTVALPTCCA